MNKLSGKLLSWGIPSLLFVAGVVAIIQGSFFLGVFIASLGAVGIIVAIMNSRYQKAASNRLAIEFKKRGIDASDLVTIEDLFYNKAANAIALVTRMYLQNKLLSDDESLFTAEAYQKISNGLINLDNPVYAQIKKFANSVANTKFAGLTVESAEEFHMNYLLARKSTEDSYNSKLGVSVAGVNLASVTLPFAKTSIEYSEPEGKITDIQNNVLTFTIYYVTSKAGSHEMNKELIYFDISDFDNPKVLLIQTDTQINNIFQLGSTKPED